MGQKSNPIVLRLGRTNQHWASCWYNDHNYAAYFLEDFTINTYIQNCSQQLRKVPSIYFLKRDRGQIQVAVFSSRPPNRTFFHAFPFAPRRGRQRRLRGSGFATIRNSTASIYSIVRSPLAVQHRNNSLEGGDLWGERVCFFRDLLFLGRLSSVGRGNSILSKGSRPLEETKIRKFRGETTMEGSPKRKPPELGADSQGHLGVFSKSLGDLCQKLTLGFFHPRKKLFQDHHYSNSAKQKGIRRNLRTGRKAALLKTYLEFSIKTQLSYRILLFMIKCPSIFQNPLFLASQVVYLLQERVSFRQLKQRLIKEIIKDATIKGMRITCSGRVATRSKKAQKARIDSIQRGETSLNIFSELVHFASRKAQTTFGKIGVKVWICYRQPRHAHDSI